MAVTFRHAALRLRQKLERMLMKLADEFLLRKFRRSIVVETNPYCGSAGAAKPCFASVLSPSTERMKSANLCAETEAQLMTVSP